MKEATLSEHLCDDLSLGRQNETVCKKFSLQFEYKNSFRSIFKKDEKHTQKRHVADAIILMDTQ